jgi:Uma2 family endonuclease
MATTKPRILLRLEYEEAAEAYCRSLSLEHCMEAPPQANQRKITLASFEIIHVARPDIQLFNELLLQYPHGRQQRIHRVVPDNVVIVWPEPIKANVSYDLPLQPTAPFWVMDYVSRYNQRKDYEANLQQSERALKIPYYLLFFPDYPNLDFFRHNGKRYVPVKPDEQGRSSIPELEIEVAILDGWLRYWFRGELVSLPADLLLKLQEARRQQQEAIGRADKEKRRADELQRQLEVERQARALAEQELSQLRALQTPIQKPKKNRT